jgi:hypothetical protein
MIRVWLGPATLRFEGKLTTTESHDTFEWAASKKELVCSVYNGKMTDRLTDID